MPKKIKSKKKKKSINFWQWLNDNILLILSGFLIAFIPLYPKIPLFDALPGYIVRVRLEDVLVAITALIWLIKTIKNKTEWRTAISTTMLFYFAVAALSVISGLLFIKTIPLEPIHFGKSFLHFVRYVEYFSLFLISFSAIKSKKDFNILAAVFIGTIIAISAYGVGQKYYYWPVYSTMNREFSKGMRLVLTEHARVQSTFGGHYDMSAFLVIALIFAYTMTDHQKTKIKRLVFRLTHLFGLWLLVVGASRTSFFAYVVGVFMSIILTTIKRNKGRKDLFFIKKSFSFGFIVFLMMLIFGRDLEERIMQVINSNDDIKITYHYINNERMRITRNFFVFLGLKEPKRPDNAVDYNGVMVSSDERPKPVDVYNDDPISVAIASTSASGETIYTIVQKEPVWSECALTPGKSLSLCIRLDELWPNAIKGFLKNPLVGSSYATLNKKSFYHFTEAESTDNNFLRTLGETGALGFITFYGTIAIALIISWQFYVKGDKELQAVSIAFMTSSVGLLINALYIDVFAASKVAFTYWAYTGMIMGLFYLKKNKKIISKSLTLKKINNLVKIK